MVTVEVPIGTDLRALVTALEVDAGDRADVLVSSLAEKAAELTVRVPATDDVEAERLASDLRLRISERLRTLGIAA